MKLNYDLIRELLLYYEDMTDGERPLSDKFVADTVQTDSLEILSYHVKYLIDAGFVEHKIITHEKVRVIVDITPAGRSYLDSVRNATVWNRVKEHFKDTLGSVAIEAVTAVARHAMFKAIGLTP